MTIFDEYIFPSFLPIHFVNYDTNLYGYGKQYTVKLVNKGHPRERQHMVFIDKWSLFGGYFVLFCQESVIEVWPLLTGWSLSRGGL